MLRSSALLSGQADVHHLSARALVLIAATAGAVLLAAAAFNELVLEPTRLSRLRAALGLALLAAAAIGQGLRARRPRVASTAVLATVLVAAWAHMVLSGVGVHALVLVAALFAVLLSGVLCSPAVAIGFALGHVAAVLAAYSAERAGWLPGLAAAAEHGAAERTIGHLVFTGVALLSAVLLARLLDASLGRALQQEQRMAELVRIGSDWTWEMDEQGFMTYISPSFEPRTGRTIAEFMQAGRPGGPLIVDDDEWRTLREQMRRREPYRERTITFQCADGQRLSVRGSGEPMLDAQGRVCGWRGVSRNVTAEETARRAHARAQSLLDRLVRTGPDAICVARFGDGAILFANPQFLRLTGRTEAEVLGRSALQLGLLRDPATPGLIVQTLRREGQLRDLRVLVFLDDGPPRPMMVSGAMFEWDGEPVVVTTIRDVAEIERARAEADAILDHASVGLALVRDGRFERVNPLFESVFGRPLGSLAGQPTASLFDAGRPGSPAADLEAASAEGRPSDVECPVRHADGTQALLRLRTRPVDPARTQQHGAIWVAEDITERRRAERELAQAKLQAEAASRAKSAFLATMSHEIRTPLNGVLGLARLMQDPEVDDAARLEYLRLLVGAAEGLAGLVSDVLDLSKIEAGHLHIETVPFELHAVLSSTFAAFATLGRERGLEMRLKLADGLPQRVRGDPVRVRQILANFLGNSLKFTRHGYIELAAHPAGGDQVRVEVHDSGPGVADAVREQIFHPFSQADRSTTRRYGGTGLGLSICRELATRMGGRVGVHSDGHSGSCFWAELALPALAAVTEPAPAAPAAERPLRGLEVLVAEDNEVNRLIVGVMLRRLGARVHEATDGEQAAAMAVALGDALHVVLMDLHMPTLDGLAAARRLRADPSCRAGLPIFALSAAVLDQERQAAADAGMNGFIAKPVSPDELLRALRPWVPEDARVAATAG